MVGCLTLSYVLYKFLYFPIGNIVLFAFVINGKKIDFFVNDFNECHYASTTTLAFSFGLNGEPDFINVIA
jgi:hypothetical protein